MGTIHFIEFLLGSLSILTIFNASFKKISVSTVYKNFNLFSTVFNEQF